jgi:hypothetical protein
MLGGAPRDMLDPRLNGEDIAGRRTAVLAASKDS